MTLPIVLVTDTNIWIGLENGEVFAKVFLTLSTPVSAHSFKVGGFAENLAT